MSGEKKRQRGTSEMSGVHEESEGVRGSNNNSSSEYFDSYGDLSVHTLMLKDSPRVEAYADAFRRWKDEIKGKIVLDVGCGTGLLSMLCSKICEPLHVYAVEASEPMARLAMTLIENNNLKEQITVLNAPVENLEFPGSHKAEVLVSEWMGFYLLHESMLDSVLYARDNLCKPNPLILPRCCTISAAAISADDSKRERVDFWSQYLTGGDTNLDFSILAQAEIMSLVSTPQVYVVKPEQVLSEPIVVYGFDVSSVKSEELNEIDVHLSTGIRRPGALAAVCLWFSCDFGKGVVLDTSPQSPATHWMQTNVFLGCWAPVAEDTVFEGLLRLKRRDVKDRQYTISIET